MSDYSDSQAIKIIKNIDSSFTTRRDGDNLKILDMNGNNNFGLLNILNTIYPKIFSFKKNAVIYSLILSIIFVYLSSISFNYNYKVGGGFILKASIFVFDNNFLLLLSPNYPVQNH